jgi:hypothetical protein
VGPECMFWLSIGICRFPLGKHAIMKFAPEGAKWTGLVSPAIDIKWNLRDCRLISYNVTRILGDAFTRTKFVRLVCCQPITALSWLL